MLGFGGLVGVLRGELGAEALLEGGWREMIMFEVLIWWKIVILGWLETRQKIRKTGGWKLAMKAETTKETRMGRSYRCRVG